MKPNVRLDRQYHRKLLQANYHLKYSALQSKGVVRHQ